MYKQHQLSNANASLIIYIIIIIHDLQRNGRALAIDSGDMKEIELTINVQ